MEASVTDVYCCDVTGGGVEDEETVLSNINNTARPAVSSDALIRSSLVFYLHKRAVSVQGHSLTLSHSFHFLLTAGPLISIEFRNNCSESKNTPQF